MEPAASPQPQTPWRLFAHLRVLRVKAFRLRRLLAFVFLGTSFLHAQTLAHPNWAGSGLNADPWWRAAVFYCITPATFQDSGANGIGDLRGIAERLDYIQSLSADAIVLESPFSDSGFDDLLDEATHRHVRLLVELSVGHDDAALAPQARQWLTRGAAGIWLSLPKGTDSGRASSLLRALRALTDSFPGQRVLVEDTSADPSALPVVAAQLVVHSLFAATGDNTDAASLRAQLAQVVVLPPGSSPLLLLAPPSGSESAPHDPELKKVFAAALLLSRGAVALQAEQEIGQVTATGTTGAARIMQWTPSNVTPAAPAVAQADASKPPARTPEDVYGAFVPYVPPTPVPKIAADEPPDLNTLPGFTSGKLPDSSASAEANSDNVAAEDRDKTSLLNLYRRLSELHHGNATLRSGATAVLNHDAENLLVWVRTPPPGTRSDPVIIACNLSDARAVISLRADLTQVSLGRPFLQPILTTSPVNSQADQTPGSITLAPWSLLIAGLER